MKILKTKFYLHKLSKTGQRPRLFIAQSFNTARAAYDFKKMHSEECGGYVVDTGRYIMEKCSNVEIAEFVEVNKSN